MKYFDEIKDLIRNNKFEHYYLFKNVLNTYENHLEINVKWKLGNERSWILGFCSNNNYNIYGLNFTHDLLTEVAKQMDFNTLPNQLCFSGNKEIIDYLFSVNPNVQYEIYKERNFYEINKNSFNTKVNDTDLKIRTALISDLEILAKYNCSFFEEEYNGQNNKDFEEMKITMKSQIDKEQYIVALNGDLVIGFCSKFNTGFCNEMIGTVYVNKENRKSKAGTLLIKKMTENVLSKNSKCWLMTDLNNIPSNKIMMNLNYNKIYEYTSGMLKKL